MTALSHPIARLSMRVLCAAGAIAVAGLAWAGTAAPSPYFGRWTVSENRPHFTARGLQYKTFDVAPCGRDFCGVSVSDRGQCGATLFRFLSSHQDGSEELRGHGRWGAAKKNILVQTYEAEDMPGGRTIEVYLGDGYDFGERSDNMPKFHAQYRRLGTAQCIAR